MISFSILTKIASILTLVVGLIAYFTPHWVQVAASPIFIQTYDILFFVATSGASTVTSSYSSDVFPVVFLFADILIGSGFVFLIVSIVRFFQAQKYNNANAANSNYARNLHMQSLVLLIATIVVFFLAMIVISNRGLDAPKYGTALTNSQINNELKKQFESISNPSGANKNPLNPNIPSVPGPSINPFGPHNNPIRPINPLAPGHNPLIPSHFPLVPGHNLLVPSHIPLVPGHNPLVPGHNPLVPGSNLLVPNNNPLRSINNRPTPPTHFQLINPFNRNGNKRRKRSNEFLFPSSFKSSDIIKNNPINVPSLNVPSFDIEAYFGFSFYLGWLSLVFSLLSFAFNGLVYKRTFVVALKSDNTQLTYSAA